MFSLAAVEGKLARIPENLIFCGDEVLFEAVSGSEDADVRARCVAELFIRAFFSQDRRYIDRLDRLLPDREFSCFHSRLAPRKNLRPEYFRERLWEPRNEFSSRCLYTVTERFELLASAEGLIPVYAKYGGKEAGRGYLIPFDLAESAAPAVTDLDGRKVEDWSGYLSRMDIPAQVRLHCHCLPGLRFTESSMMLPVLCAWLRREGRELPLYDPFRLVFSGAFDESGKLVPVMTCEKAAELAKSFAAFNYRFVIPESPGDNALGRGIEQIPCLDRAAVLENVRCIVDQLEKTTFQYALGRIQALHDKVHFSQYTEWEELIRSLRNNAVFDEDENPDEYLLNLMLQSQACCHCGRSSEAAAINRKAQAYAQDRGERFEKQLYRLQIEMLVILVDMENFEQIRTLTPDLEKKLRAMNDPDLLMRFHGTMGQICAYGALSGLPGFSGEESLSHFRSAKDKAFELGLLQDKRQDLNYLHLWHALFRPGSQAENDAFERAENMLNKEDDENYARNYWYLTRQRTFAAYRSMLSGLKPEIPRTESLLEFDPSRGIPWTQALSCKYVGALHAAEGQDGEARKCFDIALRFSPGWREPILKFIRMTILAEAWRSLGLTPYREQALAASEELAELYPRQTAKWRGFLLGVRDFPGLEYWY